jgi:hypothetical protein
MFIYMGSNFMVLPPMLLLIQSQFILADNITDSVNKPVSGPHRARDFEIKETVYKSIADCLALPT